MKKKVEFKFRKIWPGVEIRPEIDWTVWLIGLQIIPWLHRYYSETGAPSYRFHGSIYIYLGPFNLGFRW